MSRFPRLITILFFASAPFLLMGQDCPFIPRTMTDVEPEGSRDEFGFEGFSDRFQFEFDNVYDVDLGNTLDAGDIHGISALEESNLFLGG